MKKINILAPLSKVDEIEHLVKAGADEFYAGVFSKKWQSTYKIGNINNRYIEGSNFADFSDLTKAIRIAHSHNIKVNFVLNRMGIVQEQYPLVLSQAKKAISIGADSIIVADLGILNLLKKYKNKVKLHLSTLGAVFNSESASFYKYYGADRIILPRHIKTKEIIEIKRKNPDLELEAFILNCKCDGIEGFCTFCTQLDAAKSKIFHKKTEAIHLNNYLLQFLKKLPMPISEILRSPSVSGYIEACMIPYKVSLISKKKEYNKRKMINHIKSSFQRRIEKTACGACALVDFIKIGVNSVKIIGRGYPIKKLVSDISFIKKAREIANSEDSKNIATNMIKDLYKKYEKTDSCKMSSCYYSEYFKNGKSNLHN